MFYGDGVLQSGKKVSGRSRHAFMPRHRLLARGNATTFPLASENFLQSMEDAANMATRGFLPKTGPELAAVVNVIIKAGGPTERLEIAANVIHQARVRRAVVLELLADAKTREHPAYSKLCIGGRRRARGAIARRWHSTGNNCITGVRQRFGECATTKSGNASAQHAAADGRA